MKSHPLYPVMALTLVAIVGLAIGLTGDGYEDALACAGLAFCLIPIAAALRRR